MCWVHHKAQCPVGQKGTGTAERTKSEVESIAANSNEFNKGGNWGYIHILTAKYLCAHAERGGDAKEYEKKTVGCSREKRKFQLSWAQNILSLCNTSPLTCCFYPSSPCSLSIQSVPVISPPLHSEKYFDFMHFLRTFYNFTWLFGCFCCRCGNESNQCCQGYSAKFW